MKQSKSEFWSGEEYDAQYADRYSHEIALLQQIAIEQNAKSHLRIKYCYSNWQRSPYEDGVNNCVCVIQPI
ncbi:hypothetical protein EGH82_08410 [Vibrio ponticus]|uniref:Uncharacterized protein n=1 Tax=Vibrio ponticus TaxID=265668 RepID=A0A3N3E1Y7_9VIBR|nr:hypothetical protein [Vibrio ponticus]ROV60639.1 hypothetical protein EGH82_08410 [Vibrio ponticus]